MDYIYNLLVSIHELCFKRNTGISIENRKKEEHGTKKNCCYYGYESDIDSDGYSSDVSVNSAQYGFGEVTYVI